MKSKILLIAFMAVAVTLNISCKKDEKESTSLVGTWVMKQISSSGVEISEDGNEIPYSEEHDYSKDSKESTITFNANNSATISQWSDDDQKYGTETFSYAVKANKLTMTFDETETGEYTFSITGNTLKLNSSTNTQYTKGTTEITLIRK
jgi:hypothetical protein